MSIRKLLAVLALSLGMASTVRADLVITVGDVSVQAGHTAEVPVYVRSTTGTDNLANTNFQFQITQAGATVTQLAFVNPPPGSGSDPTFTAMNYVFAGNSYDVAHGIPLGFAVNQTTYPNDTFFGGDSTQNGSNVLVPTTNVLLADLDITTLTGSSPSPGDTFTISLIPGSVSMPDGSENSTFSDNLGNYLGFSSTPGTITIVTPLPKPLIASLVLFGALGVVTWFRRRGAMNPS